MNQNGLLVTIRIVKTVPDARLLIVGDDPERESLERRAAQLIPRRAFDFLGAVNHGTIHELQNQTCVQCVPSIWPENSPLVIYEALSYGMPIVATETGGIPDLITHDREGLLVPINDSIALASALERMLTDPTLRARCIPAALTRAQAMNMDRHVSELFRIYDEVIASSSRIR